MDFPWTPLLSTNHRGAMSPENYLRVSIISPHSGISRRKGQYSTDSTKFVTGFTAAVLSMGFYWPQHETNKHVAFQGTEVPVSTPAGVAIPRLSLTTRETPRSQSPALRRTKTLRNPEAFHAATSQQFKVSLRPTDAESDHLFCLASNTIFPIDDILDLHDENEAEGASTNEGSTTHTTSSFTSYSHKAKQTPNTRRSTNASEGLMKGYQSGKRTSSIFPVDRTPLLDASQDECPPKSQKDVQCSVVSTVKTGKSNKRGKAAMVVKTEQGGDEKNGHCRLSMRKKKPETNLILDLSLTPTGSMTMDV